jgi:chromosome segregation ATPase
MKHTTESIIEALRAGAWAAEIKLMDIAADRLEEFQRELKQAITEKIPPGYGLLDDRIKHLKEQMGYMQQALAYEIADGKKARDERDKALAEVERVKACCMEGDKMLQRSKQERDEASARLATFEPTIRNLTKERNEARAELARLQAERDLWQQIQREDPAISQYFIQRPEPSRLEIAAMLKAGWFANRDADFNATDDGWWIEQADALIAAAKEVI